MDLDGFKSINDTHGHDAGDFVLQEVTERLNDSIRSGDTAARVGGDEFILLITAVNDTASVERIADKIMGAMSEPMNYLGMPLLVGASIGFSLFPDDAEDFAALRRRADEAMYHRKRSRKVVT